MSEKEKEVVEKEVMEKEDKEEERDSSSLSEWQKEFLQECEQEFKDRYTEKVI